MNSDWYYASAPYQPVIKTLNTNYNMRVIKKRTSILRTDSDEWVAENVARLSHILFYDHKYEDLTIQN